MCHPIRRASHRANWFHWDGQRVVMATWVAGPHIRHPARRIEDLVANPTVAITIDTDSQPPHVLQRRGQARVVIVDGVPFDYRAAAERYLGMEEATEYLAALDQSAVRMARVVVEPEWVGLLDFETRLPGPL